MGRPPRRGAAPRKEETMEAKVKEIMLSPVCSEITEREPYNGYLIFQGGIPEVEEFIKKFHK